MKKDLKKTLVLISDIMFVMVLCFVVLLITMAVQSKASMDFSAGYYFEPVSLIVMFISITVYLVFLEKRSKKELKECQDLAYENIEKKG